MTLSKIKVSKTLFRIMTQHFDSQHNDTQPKDLIQRSEHEHINGLE